MNDQCESLIDSIRRQYASAWRNANGIDDSPALDDYLSTFSKDVGGHRVRLLTALLPIELESRARLRRLPEPAYYRFRYPELDADWLRQNWPDADDEMTSHAKGATDETDKWISDIAVTVDYPGVTGPATRPVSVPTIPGYKLIRELGRGGMGVVYLARQLAADREVALKIVLSGINASPEQLEWFRREATAAAKLDHPGIVTIYDVGEAHGLPYYSMAYVRGKNLAEQMAHKPPNPRLAAIWLAEVSEAVEFAHAHGIVHRDLKPANVLIDEAKRLRVADFGLAKRLYEQKLTPDFGLVVGTPSYMPPEQAQGRDHAVGPRADVYSLGAILYELLTGTPPFKAETARETMRQVIERPVIPPRKLNPFVDEGLETICLRCLEKSVSDRYSSARFLREELRRYLAGEPLIAGPEFRITRLWKWARRNRALSAVSIALILMVLLNLGLFGAWSMAMRRINLLEQQRATWHAKDSAPSQSPGSVEARSVTRSP